MLAPLERKGYVTIGKPSNDAGALQVELTEKTYQYFAENDAPAACETNRLFPPFLSHSLTVSLICLKNCCVVLKLTERTGEFMDHIKPIPMVLEVLILLLLLIITISLS